MTDDPHTLGAGPARRPDDGRFFATVARPGETTRPPEDQRHLLGSGPVTLGGPTVTAPGWLARMAAGMTGGLAGGAAFGVLMQVSGVLPMVAGLVNKQSIPVGWVVHLSIAAFIGALYGLGFGRLATVPSVAAVLAILYALLWWVLGGLTLMPLRLGGDLFVFDEAAWQSLAGHLTYGAVLGLVFALITHLQVTTTDQDAPVPQSTPGTADPDPRTTTPTARQTTLTSQARSLRQRQRRD